MSAGEQRATLADVSVIVVVHDSGEVIGPCLQALPSEVEAIVVDNASTDGGASIAAGVRPDVRLVQPGSNLGFGGGCQAGAQVASRPLLLFLNPDARVDGAAILRLAATLLRHPWALVGPRLLDSSGQTRPLRMRLDIRKDALWLLPASERWIPSSWKHAPAARDDLEQEVLYVEGACFLVRRRDLIETGGFDPDLFLYFEESSLAHRLKLLGGAAWYEPRALATHIGQVSTSKREAFSTFHFYRSRVILERKTFGDLVGRLRALPLLATALLTLVPPAVARLGGSRPDTLREALATLKGTIAGLTERIGPRY